MIHYSILKTKPECMLTFSCNNKDKLPMKRFQLRAFHINQQNGWHSYASKQHLNKTSFSSDLIFVCMRKFFSEEKHDREKKKLFIRCHSVWLGSKRALEYYHGTRWQGEMKQREWMKESMAVNKKDRNCFEIFSTGHFYRRSQLSAIIQKIINFIC